MRVCQSNLKGFNQMNSLKNNKSDDQVVSLFILTDFKKKIADEPMCHRFFSIYYLIFLISLSYKLWLCLKKQKNISVLQKVDFFSFSIFMCAFEDEFGDGHLKSICNIAMSANVISI